MFKIGNQIITRVVVGTNDMNSVVVGGTQVFPDNSYLKVQVAKEYADTTNSSVHYLPINNETITAYGNKIGDLIDGLIPSVDSQSIPASLRVLSIEVNTTTPITLDYNTFHKTINGTDYIGKIMTFQIPENSNVTLEASAFQSTNLSRIGTNINSSQSRLPSYLTSLPQYLFNNAQLVSVYIPSTTTHIGKYCFNNCPLKSAIFGKITGWYYGAKSLSSFLDMREQVNNATYLKSTYASYVLERVASISAQFKTWKNGYILNTTVGETIGYTANSSWTSAKAPKTVPVGATSLKWDTFNFMNTYDSNKKLLRAQLWNADTTYTLNSNDKFICGSLLNSSFSGIATATFNFEK